MENVKKTQKLAQKIGHCLCHLKIKCPCEVWKLKNKCKCSGDKSISHEEWIKINVGKYKK